MISSELYDKIFEIIEGSITVEQLEEWLVPRLPIFLVSPDSTDADVVATIELGLAEMSDGIRTRDEFSGLLRDVIHKQRAILMIYPFRSYEQNVSGSSNQTSQPTLDFIATTVTVQL